HAARGARRRLAGPRHHGEGLEGHQGRVRSPLGDHAVITKEIEIKNKLGLHARAAAKLVHTAARFKSSIKIKKGDEEVDGKSILLLAAGRGSVITVRAEGEDEAEAIAAIEQLIDAKFDESE